MKVDLDNVIESASLQLLREPNEMNALILSGYLKMAEKVREEAIKQGLA